MRKRWQERLNKNCLTFAAGDPVTADDLGIGGALTVLMKDAIRPNMMQVSVVSYLADGQFCDECHLITFPHPQPISAPLISLYHA